MDFRLDFLHKVLLKIMYNTLSKYAGIERLATQRKVISKGSDEQYSKNLKTHYLFLKIKMQQICVSSAVIL